MQFGLLCELDAPRPSSAGSLGVGFREALEHVEIAEAAGFDAVWSLEHHAAEPASAAAAPEVWLAAVAQRTQRLRIGHGVGLWPFAYTSPIRLAEMAAVLDIMCDGRLEFAAGLPGPAGSPPRQGVDADDVARRCEEALRMIPKMWTEEAFSWSSDTFSMPPRNVLPKPVQSPHPPVWLWGSEPDAASVAGELGVGFVYAAAGEPAALDEAVMRYRDAIGGAAGSGDDVHDRFASCATLFCSDDAARLDAAMCAHDAGGLDRGSAIVGEPGVCAERIEACRAQGIDTLLLRVQVASVGHEAVGDSLRRFGEEVIPRFAA